MRLAPALIATALVLVASSAVLAAAAVGAQVPGGSAPVVSAPAVQPDEAVTYKALLTRYCVACHNTANPTAGLALNTLDLTQAGPNAPVMEKLVRKLRGRMMPPPGMPRPDEATTNAFVAWMETHLDQAAAAAPDPGRVALHRLNRKEYANAVRDLFALDVSPAALLPQDDTSDGFDNIADVLQTSPIFLDQYISADRAVAIEAVGDPKLKSVLVSLKPTPGVSQNAYVEGLPLGTRGGLVTDHVFPGEGDYELTFTGSPTFVYDYPVRDDRFLVVVDGKVVSDSAKTPAPTLEKLPVGVARGRKTTVKLHLAGGLHHIGAAYVATTYQAPLNPLSPLKVVSGIAGPVVTGLDISGPTNPVGLGHSPSRDAIFICHPANTAAELPCARRIIARVARRAYRRPVTEADLEPPLRFFKDGQKVGGFETGVQQALMAILVSPSFLYRATTVPKGLAPGAPFAIDDIDLASRLSFFLWSSIPDDQLLRLAEQGRLRQPKVLQAQVRRMLADPRSESLVTNFGFQWLHLGALDTADPDPNIFPDFDADLRVAFREEMRLFMDSVLRGDQSVLKLLNADYTFVNERLARHYGVPDVVGNRFRRVELADRARWGLLGKGGVLLVTSYGNRTAPVVRGAWLLENILGTPPSPPPPTVGGLVENVDGQKALTVREMMAVHRRQASCNVCHGVMDPLGLSLENFDAIGAWRTKDRFAGEVIDASATMVSGDKMNGVVDLRAQLLKRPDQFVQTFTEKLMTFGLGRSLDYRDMPRVRAIVRGAKASDYRFSDLVMGIVQSDQFRMSRAPLGSGPTQVASSGASAGSRR